jgi:hypothetical protein
MYVGGISCDLYKVFDCINHELLLSKLHFNGKGKKAGQWELNIPHDRKQVKKYTKFK